MARGFRSTLALAVLFMVLSCGLAGWFVPIDAAIRGWRFSAFHHPVSGEIVFVDIDTDSVDKVGTWPWPRGVYAQAIDALIAADAGDIFLDIDFSARSNEFEDAKLERALRDAGGYVLLASFLQPSSDSGELRLSRPIERFAREAQIVSVNVPVDADGIVREYTTGFTSSGQYYPSAASALAPDNAIASNSFTIDFGIDIAGITHISLLNILTGDFDKSAIAGKRIVIGASALALRDTHTMPRYGALPGVVVHILAAETLLQNRAFVHPGSAASVLIALFLASILGFLFVRSQILAAGTAVLVVSASVELLALALHVYYAVALDTFVIHASIFAFSIEAVIQRVLEAGRQLERAWHAQSATRSVLNRVISDNFDGVIVVNQLGEIIMCSQLAEDVLGAGGDNALVGQQMIKALPAEIATEIAMALLPREQDAWVAGQLRQISLVLEGNHQRLIEYVVTVSVPDTLDHSDDEMNGRVVCLTFRDVTERMAAQKRLQYLADHDPLTGALSRVKFIEIINVAMSENTRRANGISIFLVSLSRFKSINDSFGHTIGDEVLRQVVQRLRKSGANAVARLGGDSFALVRSGVFSNSGMELFCQDVMSTLSQPYEIDAHKAMIGAKIGVTHSTLSGFDVETLISHADMAMSAAKLMPGNNFVVYEPKMSERLMLKQRMEVALRNALKHDELHVSYQPQVDLSSGELIGVEALVRWHHPKMGPISPAEFIPLAEETGLILEMGRWILSTACREASNWPPHIKLAVNVSPMQFEFGDVVQDVKTVLEETGFPAERLDVEITEGLMISNPELITSSLEKLRALGLGVALDDFGTGYSSLSYLGKLPIDKIKIDQSFVRGLPNDQESAAIVRAITSLAESLGKAVVAEGIETADQAWVLRLAGAQIGQGYYYGRSLRAKDLEARMVATAKGESWAIAS